MKIETSSRSFAPDAIRSVAILSVILTHTMVLPPTVTLSGIGNVIYLTFLRTCVPFFIISSGWFLLDKQESWKSVFRRIIRLIIPWIAWSIVTTIFLLEFNHPHIYSLKELAKFFLQNLFYFWFLPVIIGLYILSPLLRVYVIRSKKTLVYFFWGWFIFISLLPSLLFQDNLLDINYHESFIWLGILFSGYFVFGYLYKKHAVKLFSSKNAIVLILIGFLWTVVGLYSWMFTEQEWNFRYINYLMTNIVLVSCGLYILFDTGIKAIERKINLRIKKILQRVSTASLPIYLFHFIVLQYYIRIFNLPSYISYSFIQQVGLGLFVFLVSFAVIQVIKIIPVVNRILIY